MMQTIKAINPPAMKNGTGVVPDRPHLHRYLKVGDAMDFHAAFYPTWDARWARELMGEFQLLPPQRVARLSKGETAKLMLLLALGQLPDLLVLDEPMDGLDPVVRRDVLTALLDYVSRRHATVFVSSHLVHELERFCDWVGVMDRGRLVVEMPMAEFKEGTKRIRLGTAAALAPSGAPFTLLGSEPDPRGGTIWVVRGWRREMGDWLGARGLAVRDVSDLDLEDGFVELLRAFRAQAA